VQSVFDPVIGFPWILNASKKKDAADPCNPHRPVGTVFFLDKFQATS
jgi:hypothetical protein